MGQTNFAFIPGQREARSPEPSLKASPVYRRTFFFVLFFILSAYSYAQPPSHDPSRMIRNTDGRYWIFTTGQGIWCMSSSNANFTDWRAEPTPFGNSWPGWIANYVTGFTGFFWAPDVVKIGSTYYLYYSCAGQGAPAAIGLATATNLAGPWTDRGMVVAGNNAIDPAILIDGSNMWMTWGNWQTGIDICQLSMSNGKRANSTTTHLVSGQEEGPALIRNGSYYYLFYQRGLCCQGVNSTYYVVVARSTSVTGPYTGERTFLPNRNGNIIGPGHIGYGEGKLTYHYYDGNDNGNAKLMITTLGFGSDGWPVAGGSGSSSGGVVSGGTYRITPRHSGKAIDVSNCNSANGTNIQQWSWLDNICQRFIMTDVGGGSWRITPAVATGSAVDLTNCSGSNSANIEIWSWLNNNCQKWQLVDVGGGYYQIRSVASGKCLDVSGRSTSDGANIIQYTCNTSSTNQQFRFDAVSASGARLALSDVVEETTGSSETLVSPVPTDGMLQVELPEDFTEADINIADGTGRAILSQHVKGRSHQLDITSASSGLYILKMSNGTRSVFKKIIKK